VDALGAPYLQVQLGEGMQALEDHGALARKFCGGGELDDVE